MIDAVQDSEIVLARFNRLMQELLRGAMNRNTFRPWEIEILLDIEACNLRDAGKKDILRRYQKAVQRAMEKGAQTPMKLSEYLGSLKAARSGTGERHESGSQAAFRPSQ
jgi:hypothetical protein